MRSAAFKASSLDGERVPIYWVSTAYGRVSDPVRRGAARDTTHPASRDDLIFEDLRGLRV